MPFLVESSGFQMLKIAVLDGQEGVERITPIDPNQSRMADGGQTGGMNKAATMLTHGFTNANPMPRKSPH